jgi:DNA-directed RNA polymerase specialized sigma24 family protein/CheY-like chemotaxis protein
MGRQTIEGDELMAEASREIIRQLPYLRRYARAITGSQIRGDQYIRVALETIVQEPERIKADANIKLQLFRLFHEVWRIVDSTIRQGDGATRGRPIEAQLEALPPLERQALLLVALERFSIEQAADILRTSVDEVRRLIERAREDLKRQVSTTVLIIEDEPIIALDIAGIVTDMGHTVAGVAAREDDALAIAKATNPGLILADIQLEDGDSGIDAVQAILRVIDVPIIFVTAFPERLLTGERPEPTFLVTKPFDPDTLRVTIAQALSFTSTRPAAAVAGRR